MFATLNLYRKKKIHQTSVHCPQNILNLRIKTESVTADATVNVRGLSQKDENKSQTYTVASATAVTSSVFSFILSFTCILQFFHLSLSYPLDRKKLIRQSRLVRFSRHCAY